MSIFFNIQSFYSILSINTFIIIYLKRPSEN